MKKLDIVDRIAAAPTLTQAEQAYIVTAKWGDQKPATKVLIERLADALGTQQRWTCAYCKLTLPPAPGRSDQSFDVEHFIEKEKKWYPAWQFEPRNLALACRKCNNRKHRKRKHIFTPAGKAVANTNVFPVSPTHYGLIHPHFDVFGDYLEVHRGWLYRYKKGMENDPKATRHMEVFELKNVAEAERKNRIARLSSMSTLGRTAAALTLAVTRQAAVSDLIAEMRAAAALHKNPAARP